MVILISLYIAVLTLECIRLARLHLTTRKNAIILQNRKNELAYLLFLTSSALTDKEPLEHCFPKYLNAMIDIIHWTYHSMFRLDEERQVLIARFTGHFADWYMQELSTKVLVRVGDASVGRAVSSKQPVVVNITAVDPRFKNVASYATRAGYKALSCYPVTGKLKTHGSFCTYSTYENIFSLHDSQYLLTIANIFGAILELRLLEKYANEQNHIM